jgi:putative nucleotidyltransferase with HDIG domain
LADTSSLEGERSPVGETDRRENERRWRPRPLLSFALRAVSVLVPAAVGAASAYAFVGVVPMPGGIALVPWALGLVAISTIATAIAERIGKRFLPLAVLFRLSLVFPDRAPSRFVMARGAGNIRQLEKRIRDARDHGVDAEPARAAEQILALVAALSAHDRKTRGHSERVRAFTDLVAGELKLSDTDRDRLRWAALLHDVGKIHVPARILNKPGRPDAREWETLQAHPSMGARIAAPLLPWLGAWGNAIEQHHERFDGGGYPHALAEMEISLAARIVSVADSFEVMTAARSYKKPMSVPAARRELAACAGAQFDPAIVRAFLSVSLGKLWWTVGPMSWTALAPILGPVQRAGSQLAAAATGTTAAIVVGVAGLLPGATSAAATPAPPVSVRAATQAPAPAADHPAADGLRSGGIGGDGPGTGAGAHADVPAGDAGPGSGSGPGDEPTGSGGGGGSGGLPGGGIGVDDTVGGLNDVVKDTADTVDDVVDGAADAVTGAVDGATDVVDDLLGGGVSELVDEPVEDLTGLLGGLLGS